MHLARMTGLYVATLAACLASCTGSTPPAETPEEPPEAEPASSDETASEETPAMETTSSESEAEPTDPMQRLMKSHFKEAALIRVAVIQGKPEDAAKSANALAHMDDVEKLPESWRPLVQRLQAAASRVKDSGDVAEAAAGTADIGTSCGACHQKLGGPAASNAPAPEVGDTLTSRMVRHAWATERLWEGLYVPSSPAWSAGAKALALDEFPAEVLKKGGVHARTAAKDFKTIVGQAGSKSSLESRATLYAELLRTCAGCHIAVKGE